MKCGGDCGGWFSVIGATKEPLKVLMNVVIGCQLLVYLKELDM